MPVRPSNRDGFALLAVLWITVVMSLIGLDFSLRARSMTRRVINAADHSAAVAAARGCSAHAEARLRARVFEARRAGPPGRPGADPWATVGALVADTIRIGQSLCTARLEDVGRRLHLNEIDEGEFRRLLIAVRVDAGDADRVAQLVMDWRDVDDLRRGRGAERSEYIESDEPRLPGNAPFGSVDELLLVRGMTHRIFDRVSPHLTVIGSGRVNISTAPAEVLSALPGMSNDLLAEILRARAGGVMVPDLMSLTNELGPEARDALGADLPQLLARVSNSVEEVAVHGEGWSDGSDLRVRSTSLAIRGAGDAVFVVDLGMH